MTQFEITNESCSIGFHKHIKLDITKPIDLQLNRHRLVSRAGIGQGDIVKLKSIIEQNSSLRVAFGWSFESAAQYEEMMDECINIVMTKYNGLTCPMASDLRSDWLGFMPFNVFEKMLYEHLDVHDLIIFNNKLIDFQIEVTKFISTHKCFLQHSLLRNATYRFNYYKLLNKNPDELSEAFHYYIDSIKDIVGITTIPRRHIEIDIGCHYLYHPEIFFELLEFYKLKGVIYE